jgi:hypothetical protein
VRGEQDQREMEMSEGEIRDETQGLFPWIYLVVGFSNPTKRLSDENVVRRVVSLLKPNGRWVFTYKHPIYIFNMDFLSFYFGSGS